MLRSAAVGKSVAEMPSSPPPPPAPPTTALAATTRVLPARSAVATEITANWPAPPAGTRPGIAQAKAPKARSCRRMEVTTRMPQAAGKEALTKE